MNTVCPAFGAETPTLVLPKAGTMVLLSPTFAAPTLRGIKIHKEDPFRFDFVLDQGDADDVINKTEAARLVKYFLAAVTTPQGELWVNLSPYEKDRIVPESFGQTEMGRDLLAQDYILKQLTASIIYPESKTGKEFWAKVYAQANAKFGSTNVPINTFNKVWIVPAEAEVYENATSGSAYVVKSQLKVLLEGDYLALNKAQKPQGGVQTQKLGTDIVREVVIPLLTREVNEGQNFATIRQVYNSLILATWYKKKIKDSVLSQSFANQNKTAGIRFQDNQTNEKIYQEYLEAFKAGAYNYIKEEQDPLTQKMIPRKYFSGGASFAMTASTMRITNQAMTSEPKKQQLIEVSLNFVGATPLLDNAMLNKSDNQTATVNPNEVTRRSVLSKILYAFVAGTVLAVAKNDSGKQNLGVIVTGYPVDVQARLEATIKDTTLTNALRVQQLKDFLNDYVQAQISRIKQETNAFYTSLEQNPKADLVVIYEANKDNISPEEIRFDEPSYIQRIREDIVNLFKAIGDKSTPEKINEIVEAVLYGFVEPRQMAKMANPKLFEGRKVYRVYMAPETLNNPDAFKIALASIKGPNSESVVAILNPRNTSPQTQQWTDVVKRDFPSTNILVANQIGISSSATAMFESVFFNSKYFSVENASRAGTTQEGLIIGTKRLLINRTLDHFGEDLKNFNLFLDNLAKLVEKSGDAVTLIQFVPSANPDEANKMAKSEEVVPEQAIKKSSNIKKMIDLIWANGGRMNFSGEDAKSYAKQIVENALLNFGELLLVKYPQLSQKKVRLFKVYISGDIKLAERINGNRFDIINMLVGGVVESNDINFLVRVSRAGTIEEIDALLTKNAKSWESLRSKVGAMKRLGFEGGFKGGKEFLADLDQRLVDEKSRVLLAQKQGEEIAVKTQQILNSDSIATVKGDVVVLVSLDQASGLSSNMPKQEAFQTVIVQDKAMNTSLNRDEQMNSYGGIDLNQVNLNVASNGQNINFDLTPELLERTRNATGFTPVILNILPLSSLKDFLR